MIPSSSLNNLYYYPYTDTSPFINTLNNCMIKCNDDVNCIGFNRQKSTTDNSFSQCFFKANASNIIMNDPEWRSYVKNIDDRIVYNNNYYLDNPFYHNIYDNNKYQNYHIYDHKNNHRKYYNRRNNYNHRIDYDDKNHNNKSSYNHNSNRDLIINNRHNKK